MIRMSNCSRLCKFDCLVLDEKRTHVDCWTFEELYRDWQSLKQQGKVHTAEEKAQAAIALYKGDFLPEFYNRLVEEKRHEYKEKQLFGKKSRRRDSGGAVTFLINIGFIIKVYIDGNWNIPFASWTFDYLVYSYLWVIIWMVIIFGIPLVIGIVWWIHRGMKNNP